MGKILKLGKDSDKSLQRNGQRAIRPEGHAPEQTAGIEKNSKTDLHEWLEANADLNEEDFDKAFEALVDRMEPEELLDFKEQLEKDFYGEIWKPRPRKLNLSSLLNGRRVTELFQIARENGYKLPDIKKADLVRLLAATLAGLTERRVHWLTMEMFNLWEAALERNDLLPANEVESDLELLRGLMTYGLLFPVTSKGQKYLAVPDEHRKLFSKKKRDRYREECMGSDAARSILQELLTLHGILPMAEMLSMMQEISKQPFDEDLFRILMSVGMPEDEIDELVEVDGVTYVTSGCVADVEAVAKAQAALKLPYRRYTLEELASHVTGEYLVAIPGQAELMELLSAHIGEENAEMEVDDLIDAIQQGIPGSLLLQAFEQILENEPESTRKQARKVFSRMHDQVPQWELRGHSAAEVARSGQKVSFTLLSTGFEPAAGARCGRNDPCPCGSGRKFKQCCGK